MNNLAIDSCSLFVPFSLMNSYDTRLDETTIEMTQETGELDFNSIKQRTTVKHVYNNETHTTYYKRTTSNINSKHYRDGIQLNITSKHLQHDYAKGITIETIRSLHHNLMLENIIDIDFNSFMQCPITDIDIKQDHKLPSTYETFNDMTAAIKSRARPELFGALTKSMTKRFTAKTNQGIQFSSRDRSSTLPHFKIYNKRVELEHNSIEFNKTYKPDINDHIVRFEVNLKNKKQMLKYNLLLENQHQTLATILNNIKEKTFGMTNIVDLYISATRRTEFLETVDETIKYKKVEIQTMKFTRTLFNKTAMTSIEVANEVMEVLEPAKRDYKALFNLSTDTYERLAFEADEAAKDDLSWMYS